MTTPPLLATRDALAAAISPGAFANEHRREVRISHGIPLSVACAQDEAYEIADRILAAGVVRAPETLADDEGAVAFIAVATPPSIDSREVRAVLTALPYALTENPS